MSDNDLIRRGEVQRAVNLALCKAPLKTTLGLIDALNDTKDAIAALPAVTVDPAAIREAALREALKAIGDLSAEFSAGGSPTAAKVLELAADRIEQLVATNERLEGVIHLLVAHIASVREAAIREAIEAYPRGICAIVDLIEMGKGADK